MRLFSSQADVPRSRSVLTAALGLLLNSRSVLSAIVFTVGDDASAKAAIETAAYGLAQWYTGNNTGDIPGNLPAPYYWWEAGATFMTFVDYWYYTGDTTYNDMTTAAIQWQKGPNSDFMNQNQSRTTGNDDQAFWAFAAMEAAELKFPNPPDGGTPWLALAQAVFNEQANRWDDIHCGGGLRWQVFPFNTGWNYKNTISNGCFFSLASRLHRYTGNETYALWANKAYDWVVKIGLMDSTYHFYDGTDLTVDNCGTINHIQWTYNTGVFMHGAASMYSATADNVTAQAKWKTALDGILATTAKVFFVNSVMTESACEPNGKCNNDQQSFKAYLSRWMAVTTQLAPYTKDTIMPLLQASATAAGLQCDGSGSSAPRGSQDGQVCGLGWVKGAAYDGLTGPGEQMAAVQIFGANLIGSLSPPVTNATGGISKGDYNAGTGDENNPALTLEPVTTGDRVGAAFLTILVLVIIIAGAYWLVA